MTTWAGVRAEAPALVDRAEALLGAQKHLTMATLRRDGSPRISGTELKLGDGEVWIAGMPQSRKLADLRRDGRVAVHSASADAAVWRADAKLAGLAVEVTDPAEIAAFGASVLGQGEPDGGFELFRVDVRELVVVSLGGDPPDHLVIDAWHEGRGLTRTERR